ncbi:MAG: hypothetical protein IKG11_03575 [Atopobiaceae bacterium]|nr:hypothetical protein [Atopobiaceae bacterium]
MTFSNAGEPSLLKKLSRDSFTRYGNDLTLPLGDYGIKLVHQDGLYLIPLQTLADFIVAPANGPTLYFNGKYLIVAAMKAHKQIHRENSPIENVVVDLSCNAGGDADCAIFLIAWFLGEAAIGTKDCMTGAMCTSTYRCDASRDSKFDEGDTVTDKNLFCLISPFSFSCANLVPCMFKESGRVTLLGRTSGGGACNVQPISSAWGTSFQISAPRRLSFLKNGSFYDIDRGADPDFVLTKPDQFYDRPALTDYINSLCWGGK